MRTVIVALVFFATIASAAGQSWSAQKQRALSNALGPLIGASGVSISLHANGTPIFEHAQGFAGPNVLATPGTRYPIASLTKQMTAAAIVALHEDGAMVPFTKQAFSIDTPVTDLFAGVDAWAPLSVRELLAMCSGLPDYTQHPLGLNPHGPVPWQGLLQSIKALPRTATQCHYSNTNYFLLAQAIEVASAGVGGFGDYRAYMRQRVFARAGMSRTGFLSDPEPFARGGLATVVYSLPDWPKGAGDVVSTVGDMQRWNTAFLSGGIVSQGSVQTLTTQVSSLPEIGPYAMGWQPSMTPFGASIQHSGVLPAGYSSFNQIVFTQRGALSVVILSNVPGGGAWPRIAIEVVGLALAP